MFTIAGLCAVFDIDTAFVIPLSEALTEAGLPV